MQKIQEPKQENSIIGRIPHEFHSAGKLSDSELYNLAQEYGLRAKQWLRKFEGLLPEIHRRRLYKRRGFASIHEFAAKLAGMSHEKTGKILRLANQLEDKPNLKALLELGRVAYSKLHAVAYVATPETEAHWAEKVKHVPRAALELCVQEVRKINGPEVGPGANLQPEKVMCMSAIRAATNEASMLSIKMSAELEFELRVVKQKMEKEQGERLGFAEVLKELLRVYKSAGSAGAAASQKSEPKRVIQLCPKCIKDEADEIAEWTEPKRTIPMKVQHLVTARQQGRCAFPNCEKPPEIFHHTRRFTLEKNHDPDFIVHLCTPHERLAHAGLIENEGNEPSAWRIRALVDGPRTDGATKDSTPWERAKINIDKKLNAYRQEPALMP